MALISVACHAYSQQIQQERYVRNKPKKEINLPNYDEKLLHYGFFLGLNYDRVNIRHASAFFNDSIYKSVTPIGEAGFSLGFLMNVRLHDQLAFKIVPSVGFYTRTLEYRLNYLDSLNFITEMESKKTAEMSMIETQFLLKYRSLRRKNTRMYLVGGFKPSVRAGGRRSDGSNQRLSVSRFDFSVEYGAGLEIYFPYFKWSPEIRFSHGLININEGNGFYNRPIASMLTHTVSLYFFFE